MKISLIISTLLHTMVLGWGLFWLSPPKSFEVADIEALPVDIIPVSSITRVQEGERDAPAAEIAARTPTTRPDPVEDALNAGDNTVDLASSDAQEPSPRAVEAASEPEQSSRPTPAPAVEPQAEQQPANEAAPAAATEVAALPEPQQAVAPEPEPEAAVAAEAATTEFAALPDTVPTPVARPQTPQAQTAKTPERRDNPDPSQESRLATARDSQFDADQVAALLNRQDPAGGGARRSSRDAALGDRSLTEHASLSQSEMDALRGQIQRCWQVVPGMADGGDVRVRVTMRLNRSGEIDGQPTVDARGGSEQTRRVLAGGARRAVLRCAPYELPPEKYETWADVVVNFDPSKMF